MITTDNTKEVLNDLVAINNDRIKGYENALKELGEDDEEEDDDYDDELEEETDEDDLDDADLLDDDDDVVDEIIDDEDDDVIDESSNADLKHLFLSFIRESQEIKMALGNEIQAYGGTIESGTTVSGKIYRTWMDLKVIFTGHNRKSILARCEFGEDAAQKAYASALEEDLPAYIVSLLEEQKQRLKISHDKIKALRDLAS